MRDGQVERAEKMIASESAKKQRKNPNDPARFIGSKAATADENEAMYDGLYAVCSDFVFHKLSKMGIYHRQSKSSRGKRISILEKKQKNDIIFVEAQEHLLVRR